MKKNIEKPQKILEHEGRLTQQKEIYDKTDEGNNMRGKIVTKTTRERRTKNTKKNR